MSKNQERRPTSSDRSASGDDRLFCLNPNWRRALSEPVWALTEIEIRLRNVRGVSHLAVDDLVGISSPNPILGRTIQAHSAMIQMLDHALQIADHLKGCGLTPGTTTTQCIRLDDEQLLALDHCDPTDWARMYYELESRVMSCSALVAYVCQDFVSGVLDKLEIDNAKNCSEIATDVLEEVTLLLEHLEGPKAQADEGREMKADNVANIQ